MTQDLKTRIENIYALDRERTQGDWRFKDEQVLSVCNRYRLANVCQSGMGFTFKNEIDGKFLAAAPEMVDIIRSLEAKVESVNAVSVEQIEAIIEDKLWYYSTDMDDPYDNPSGIRGQNDAAEAIHNLFCTTGGKIE